MIAEQLITIGLALQLPCHKTGMDFVRCCKAANVSLGKEWRFDSYEVTQLLLRYAKLSGGFVRDALLFWNVGANACAFTLKLNIQHHGRLPVLLNNVLKLMAQDKPKIIDAIKPQAHPNHGGFVV